MSKMEDDQKKIRIEDDQKMSSPNFQNAKKN